MCQFRYESNVQCGFCLRISKNCISICFVFLCYYIRRIIGCGYGHCVRFNWMCAHRLYIITCNSDIFLQGLLRECADLLRIMTLLNLNGRCFSYICLN